MYISTALLAWQIFCISIMLYMNCEQVSHYHERFLNAVSKGQKVNTIIETLSFHLELCGTTRFSLAIPSFAPFALNPGPVSASCICSSHDNCHNITDDTSFDSIQWLDLSPDDTFRIHHCSTPYVRNISINHSGCEANPITICVIPNSDETRLNLQVAVGLTPSTVALAGDADGNGCIGIGEAIAALRKVAGIASE